MYAFNNVRYELVGLDLNPFNYNQLWSSSDAFGLPLNKSQEILYQTAFHFLLCMFISRS